MSEDRTPRRRARSLPQEIPRTLLIHPWIDPIVDRRGHDPRSLYVEHFWLGVIGPTATWLLRRLAAHFDGQPSGGDIDVRALAESLGLSVVKGPSSPFGRALQRCVMFGAARPVSDDGTGWEVRRRLPTVAQRHLRKLPVAVQQLHESWNKTTIPRDSLVRAHRLAAAMAENGDTPNVVEAQLLVLGIAPGAASAACDHLRGA
jgi:hypothetical protein